jgi:CRP-like cAMP-binding protein
MERKGKLPFDPKVFLSKVNGGRAISDYRKDQIVYTQGEPADSVFYIQSGKVKKTVVSEQGKEAVVALLGTGDFFGEGCLTGQPLRLATVSAMTECVIVQISKADITRVIHEEPAFAELFIAHLLARNSRVEEDLVDQFVQFERETAGTDPSASGEFWQGRSAGANHSKSQPGDVGGDDWNDAISREFFYEQISGIGSY